MNNAQAKMTLTQLLGASLDIAIGGVNYTISPLKVKHRLAAEKWLLSKRLAMLVGNIQDSPLAMLPEQTRSDAVADIIKNPPSFGDVLRSEEGRYYVLYLACGCCVDKKPVFFEDFIDHLESIDIRALECVAYWLGKLGEQIEVDGDHPLVSLKGTSLKAEE